MSHNESPLNPDNIYTKMQREHYNKEATEWSLNNKNPVIGNYDLHSATDDYDLLLKGIDGIAKLGLDFGCGPGRNLVRFGRHFKRLDGVDISPICLQKAWEHLEAEGYDPSQIRLYECNGLDVSTIVSNYYDVVMSTITLQHICVYEIRKNYIFEFYRILKSGGTFSGQMGFGNRQGAVDYYDNHYDAEGTNGWVDVKVTDPTQLEQDFRDAGFTTFTYSIEPVSGGDVHDNWIYFRATK